jgi:hypothetical protein
MESCTIYILVFFFLVNFGCCSQSDSDPAEDLARFGYKPAKYMKIDFKKKIILLYFLATMYIKEIW